MVRSIAPAICISLVMAVGGCMRSTVTVKLEQVTLSPRYEIFFFPVFYDEKSAAELAKPAQRLGKILNWPDANPMPRNPVCCFWIELTHWTPNPGQRGYIVIIQPGGAILLASDVEQVGLAISQIETLRRAEGKHVMLPQGLLTNFPSISLPASESAHPADKK